MLFYHPIFDIHHCCFRILRLLSSLPAVEHEVDKIRIMDLYLLFPTLLKKVQMPKTAVRFKKYYQNLESPYETIENPYKLLMQLEPIQQSALGHLSSCNIINPKQFIKGGVLKTEAFIPDKLVQVIDSANNENSDLMSLLSGPFFNIDFYGKNGLKARTGLLEHKYDAK